MNKNIQIFIFFMITCFIGAALYYGSEIRVEQAKLNDRIGNLQNEVIELRGALQVLKNFEGVIEESSSVGAAPTGVKEAKDNNKEIKPIEGFYCNMAAEELIIVEMSNEDNNIRYWEVPREEIAGFTVAARPAGIGNYVRKGTTIFATLDVGGMQQNRRIFVQKVDDRGYIRQIEVGSLFLSFESCPETIKSIL